MTESETGTGEVETQEQPYSNRISLGESFGGIWFRSKRHGKGSPGKHRQSVKAKLKEIARDWKFSKKKR